VQPGVKPPPSLVNIFQELQSDLAIEPARHGYLQSWAEQGVLLLNSVLTVEQGQAGAHQGKGWEQFTDAIVSSLNQHRDGLVFLLWGSHAQKKGAAIDSSRHCVLKAPHPSPLSAYRGFFGCKHFSQANAYLEARGQAPVDWRLPSN
jgi:uracil-DNA glycosylase